MAEPSVRSTGSLLLGMSEVECFTSENEKQNDLVEGRHLVVLRGFIEAVLMRLLSSFAGP